MMSGDSTHSSNDSNELVRRRKLQEHLFSPSSEVSQETLDAIRASTIRRAKTGDAESLKLMKDFPDFFGESASFEAPRNT